MTQTKIIFHKRWRDATKDLSNEARLEVYDAIVQYAFEGKSHEFVSPMAKMAFVFIKEEIDASNRKQDEISIKRKLAGKKGGKATQSVSRKKTQKKEQQKTITQTPTPIAPPLMQAPKQEIQKKEQPQRNAKPIKVQYAEYVLLTESEYQNLVNQHGENATKWMITKLDNYKASTGKKYQSDYRAILNWVVQEYYTNTKGYGNQNTGRIIENPQYPSESTYSSTL